MSSKTDLNSSLLSKFNRLSLGKVFLLLVLLGFACYGNSISHPFVHDDVVFIQQNPDIKKIDFAEIFLSPTSPSGQSNIINLYYRPVLELFYRLQYKIFKLNPHGFHLFNVILHILNAFLVFLTIRFVLKKDTYRNLTAQGVAIFFLIHPVQSEAVACISGISNTLLTLLILLSFNLYLYSKECSTAKSRIFFFFLSVVSFLCALFTKEQAIVLPCILFFYELFLGGEKGSRRPALMRILIFVVSVFGYFSFRKIIFGSMLKTGIKFDQEFYSACSLNSRNIA